MVFQSYALYPKMTVRENLSFGLRVAGFKREEIDKRVKRAAETLQLETMLHRRPAALSGGQRQRVAIGRVLVRDAEVFLFDEPLSNLDAQLRVELRREIKRLHRHLGSTSVYVTHDQVEALTLADLIAVMNKGRIEQLGTPEEIYSRPATRYVAAFIGSPAMNFIDGAIAVDGGQPWFRWGASSIPIAQYQFEGAPAAGPATFGIRPEHITFGEVATLQDYVETCVVDMLEPMGADTLIWLKTAGGELIGVRAPTERRPKEGERIPVGFSAGNASIFNTATGLRL
jgi:multiple sugar transport system ATP-binding protein